MCLGSFSQHFFYSLPVSGRVHLYPIVGAQRRLRNLTARCLHTMELLARYCSEWVYPIPPYNCWSDEVKIQRNQEDRHRMDRQEDSSQTPGSA